MFCDDLYHLRFVGVGGGGSLPSPDKIKHRFQWKFFSTASLSPPPRPRKLDQFSLAVTLIYGSYVCVISLKERGQVFTLSGLWNALFYFIPPSHTETSQFT